MVIRRNSASLRPAVELLTHFLCGSRDFEGVAPAAFKVTAHACAAMAKQLSRIGRLSCRIFGDIPRELSYRLVP